METSQAYQDLLSRMKELTLLNTTAGVLSWDQEVLMPPANAPHRGGQMALLAGMIHERFTSPKMGELLDQASSQEKTQAPLSDAAVNLREWKRSYERARRLPQSLVEELARVSSQAQVEWVEARREKSFSRFEPWLARLVELVQQQSRCYGYEKHPYDALLEDYEPGLTTQVLDDLFPPLAENLTRLLFSVANSPVKPDRSLLHRTCPVALQEAFCRDLASSIGFDFSRGRLDVSAHPFTTGLGPSDTRITTRFDPNDFCNSFFSALHEAGHGLYDQALPAPHFGTPCGEAVSLGIHESQSRLWENLVGRSLPFWVHFFPLMRQKFPGVFDDVTLEDFHLAINQAAPSLIRTEADEISYNLHIILRYELEKDLLTGSLLAKDVPEAWNHSMEKKLGLVPGDDALGCLQDVHWSHGSFGYFPTYTLGNLFAAQFMEAARRDLPSLEDLFSRGDFTPLRNWLREKIHLQGQRFRSEDLCLHVTGKPLSSKAFTQYLSSKYGALYQIR